MKHSILVDDLTKFSRGVSCLDGKCAAGYDAVKRRSPGDGWPPRLHQRVGAQNTVTTGLGTRKYTPRTQQQFTHNPLHWFTTLRHGDLGAWPGQGVTLWVAISSSPSSTHTTCIFEFYSTGVRITQDFFHHNLNVKEISFYSHPNPNKVIFTKLCAWHDSCAVVACAKFCCDINIDSNLITAK